MAQIQWVEQAPPLELIQRAITVTYTNWRNETARRRIVPIEVYWGKTEWHPQEQWLLKVWDIDRGAYREYALNAITAWH